MRTTTPFTTRARTAVGIALGAGLAASLMACSDTSGADEAAVGSTEEWCEVALEVDAVVGDRTPRNTIHHDLQDAYAEARVLVQQMIDGLDHVDADHREQVAALGDAFIAVADAIAAAPDQRAAESALAQVLEDADPAAESGAAWVAETCDPA